MTAIYKGAILSIVKRGPRVRKGKAMLQRHKRIFMNTKCTFKCRETIMTAAIEAGQRIGACLHTDGSSGSPGQDDA